jgi:hypothetical protein
VSWRLVVAPGVQPADGCEEALESAREQMPDAVLFAAVVPGDEAWPRILDKEDAIEACRHGLVALRAVQPGVLLARADALLARADVLLARADVPDFAASAALLARSRGYLVPAATARRTGPQPRVPRLRLLTARHWTREERLWQLFLLARRRPRGPRP